MARVSFGIGGFGGKERKFLAEVESQPDKIMNLSKALQDLGFWTVISDMLSNEPTTITIGEVIVQR